MAILLGAAVLAAPLLAAPLRAQEEPVVIPLDELLVVAEGTEGPLRESVGAATVLTRADIEAVAARTLPHLLRQVAGLVFLEGDGAGGAPLSVARGFYGGGETEYLLVFVDGVLLNDLRTGGVDWTRVHPERIERIEVLRGGGSALYGDQAVGAVVNIETRAPTPGAWSAGLAGGGWDTGEARAAGAAAVAGGTVDAAFDLVRTAGYRDHSDRRVEAGSVGWTDPDARLRIDARYVGLRTDDPGPLTPDRIRENRRQSHPLFAGDEEDRRVFDLGLHTRGGRLAGAELRADLRTQIVDQDRTRTILLTPGFGDTQRHDEESRTVAGRAALERSGEGWTWTAGIEAALGTYDSRYLDPAGTPLTRGDGERRQGAVLATGEWWVHPRVKLAAGGRFDAFRVEGGPDDAVFEQFSPRLGINLAYARGARSSGHLYASWGRAFKTPTLDQLYDARAIPAGPGVLVSLSNPDLQPQRSTAWEAGFYQGLPVGRSRTGALSLALYRIDLEDEIDFDLNTFRYGNIQESRHLGIEAQLDVPLTARLSVVHALTLSRAEFGTGDFEGNQLKNVPRRAAFTALRARLPAGVTGSVAWRHVGRLFLDDANREEVAPRNVLDLQAAWSRGVWTLEAGLVNALDARGEEGGFLLFDPAAQRQERLLQPSGGRVLRVGLRTGGRE